jgi:cell division control protein 11
MSFAGRRRGNKVKKGVQFTIMVVGASGTGRTTFVNTLCESDVLAHKESPPPAEAHVEQGVRITTHTVGECACTNICAWGDNITNGRP